MTCQGCGALVRPDDKFCAECGVKLGKGEGIDRKARGVSERKQITAMFADVSGYTTLAERLDPEEVREIMNALFNEITKIILKYEGFIEKFAGDAVLAIFGIPWSHEDDPIRAIKAAQEFHRAVRAVSQQFQNRIEEPLSVHIGINTGLVVTGEINLDEGTHQIAGDSINVASRLCSLAKAGETLIGQITYSRAEGIFSFERLEPVKVKGRIKPVLVYKILGTKELPTKTHRISGRRADLIGRQAEMVSLHNAVEKLLKGRGSVIAVCGKAGTGKSRLLEEFKAHLDNGAIQWYEGYAYECTQNIPYYPFIDLLNRTCQIDEGDAPEIAREKAEKVIKDIIGEGTEVLPYLGGMLSIPYLELEDVKPDTWKAHLHRSFLTLFSAWVRKAPTIIILEDLHWADPSSLELLRFLLAKSNYPALFLCAYRPPLNLFSDNQIEAMGELYQEVKLKDLSPEETQLMVISLLKAEGIPLPLKQFIQERVGGNPFYVEEVVNSLIDSGNLVQTQGGWQFTGSINEITVPPTIQGVIMARLDRLDTRAKEILQEASVIGRTFYQEILESITALKEPIDQHLQRLRELDLIRVRSFHPDVEYYFKHALIHETVYDGILKKQRKDIHERIGLALEKFFKERSLEAWETLAFQFKRGRSIHKAVDYLARSGEKSLKRYALEEANQYYREAFDLLSHHQPRTKEEDILLIDLLMNWRMVFYYQGRFEGMSDLLLAHVDLVESLEDKAKIGAFYAWLGHAIYCKGTRLGESYRYLHKALELGEETDNQQVIGSACGFLIKTCAEMGLLKEASNYENRAREMLDAFASDIFFLATYYSGKGYIGWFTGDKKSVYESAKDISVSSSLRCQMVGNLLMAFWHFMDQNMEPAVECAEGVISHADPYHAMFGRLLLGIFMVQTRKFDKAERLLIRVIEDSEKEHTDYLKPMANLFLGMALAAQGLLGRGTGVLESVSQEFLKNERIIFYCLAEAILGNIYLQVFFLKSGKRSLSSFLKNFGFFLTNFLFAKKKAETHLITAYQLAKETGAKGFLGQPCLHLGMLYKARGQKEKAKKYFLEAVNVFEEGKFEGYLNQGKKLLDSLANS
jgi:class 3 adenylate cyclase/tetratricopeptide (TPR) repeat protein